MVVMSLFEKHVNLEMLSKGILFLYTKLKRFKNDVYWY